MMNPKTFFIRTYGCQMNELDSEVMSGLLLKRGLTPAPEEESADILIFNTCSVRDLAERKVMGKIGLLGRSRKKRIIGLAGCMAILKREKLLETFPHLDFVIGPNNIMDLNSIIDSILLQKKQVLKAAEEKENIDYNLTDRKSPVKAAISIIRGCNKFCTYCIVPKARGKEASRPPQSIIEEVSSLLSRGYKEITLLGQNVNSYGKDHPEWNVLFHDLLYSLDRLPFKKYIRFLTSHPTDISQTLMEAIRDLPSVCRSVHFPLQAGSNRILRKMGRMYTKEDYLEKVATLKNLVPDIHLGTDIIVGFPSENDADFRETCDMFKRVSFDTAFIFTYSPRKNTPAIKFEDDVPLLIKKERHQTLLNLHKTINDEKRRKRIGTSVEVLVEHINRDKKTLKGKTSFAEKVIFNGSPSIVGSFTNVTLKKFDYETYFGDLMID